METMFSVDLAKNGNILLWILILLCSALYFILRRKSTNIPGPTGLPILGYLPFLGKNAHITLYKLSQKYGSVFGLYMGRTYVVVVTDISAAKEFFSKPTVQDREEDAFSLMPGGFGFGILNGHEWIEQRRYVLREMKEIGLSGSSWEKLVQSEVMDILDLLMEANGEAIDVDKHLAASISNNILSMVLGERLPMRDPGRDILYEGLQAFQLVYDQSGIVNYFPTLFSIAVKLGFLKVDQKLKDMENLNKFLKKLIGETRSKCSSSFINHYVEEIENKKCLDSRSAFTDSNLIGNSQSLIMAGTDTTRSSISWLLLAMASYLDIQDKVQKELDTVFSDQEIASWDDRYKLPYCYATILEGQRWRTLAPLGVLRRTSEDTEIQGYVVPKGTNVMSHLWAFHNDTRYWKNPEKFQPERFLSDDGKTVKRESYEPFSIGKRRCPGETVAYIEIFIYFTAIMRKFRVLSEKEGTPVDLEGILGLTYQHKKQPLRFIPRIK